MKFDVNTRVIMMKVSKRHEKWLIYNETDETVAPIKPNQKKEEVSCEFSGRSYLEKNGRCFFETQKFFIVFPCVAN